MTHRGLAQVTHGGAAELAQRGAELFLEQIDQVTRALFA